MSDDGSKAEPIDGADAGSQEAIQSWMILRLAEKLQVPPAEIDVTMPVMQFGLDSIVAFSLTGELADRLECDLPASLFWDYPTLESIAKYLTEFKRSADAQRRVPLRPRNRDQHEISVLPGGS